MAWFSNFLEKIFSTKERYGSSSTIVVDIPAELYYKELALYTATSLISNAIARSEFQVYQYWKKVKNADYYMLNISPNANDTSSYFWHRVFNKLIRDGEALVVEVKECMYLADSFTISKESTLFGDTYSNVTVGNFQFEKTFYQSDVYHLRINDVNVKCLIDGMYNEYGDVLKTAASAFKSSNGQKYKIHIDGIKAGDEGFNKEFEGFIADQLKEYIGSDTAIYPEFDGYLLTRDSDPNKKTSDDYIKLQESLFERVYSTFHIPLSMVSGNITNVKDVMNSFLVFGVDPYADMIEESLNKRAGSDNFVKGNYYRVNTSKIRHRDVFDIADGIFNIIGSGTMNIDEVRDELDLEELGTEWSKKFFISKNFGEINEYLKEAGGKKDEK